MKKIVIALILQGFCLIAYAEEYVYHAVINDKINALITLEINKKACEGQVYYDASGEDGLVIDGTINKSGKFEWQEKLWDRESIDQKTTGRFSGTLDNDRKTGQGEWTSADNKKKYSLKLTRIAKINSLKHNRFNASTDYPEFDDPSYSGLNKKLFIEAQNELADHIEVVKNLRAEMKDDLSPERLDQLESMTSCRVEIARPEIISLLCIVSEYSGGAHGMYGPVPRNYKLTKNGSVTRLTLWDVLEKSPENIKILSDLLITNLKRQKASNLFPENADDVNPFGKIGEKKIIADFSKELEADEIGFTVVPAGLAFHFAPYHVGSGAEGMFRSVISKRDLAALYLPSWPLSK